jgi:hypothetical protein
MSRWLFLPHSALKDLEVLATLPPEKLDELRAILASDTGKRRYEVSLQIAEAIKIADEDAAGLYTLWRYAQDERKDSDRSGADVIDEFIAFLDAKVSRATTSVQEERFERTAKSIRSHRDALSRLFDVFPDREKTRKAYSLGLGPLPHFVNIKAICDIRPIYDEDATTIEQHAAVFTLRIVSHDNQGKYKEMDINISEEDVTAIEEEVKRLRKKVALIKEQYPDLVISQPHSRKRRP